MSSRRRIFRQLKTWKKYDRRYRARGVRADTPGYDNAYLRAALANAAKVNGCKHPFGHRPLDYIAKADRTALGARREGTRRR